MTMSMSGIVHSVRSLDAHGGGVAASVPTLVNALMDIGVGCQLVAITTDEHPAVVPASLQSCTTLVKGHYYKRLRLFRTPGFRHVVTECCRKTKACLVHAHGIWTRASHDTTMVARAMRLPLIVSPHGSLAPWAMRHKAWKKVLAWPLYQRRDLRAADLFHATSIEEAHDLRTLGFTQPIAVIPFGVNIPTWQNPCDRPLGSKRVALFLSRIHPVKGLSFLVDAWAAVRPQGWQVVVAGPDEGGHLSDIRAAIQRHGLTEHFEFIGPVHGNEKWDLYRRADVFVLPTFSENFGMVIAEALACGVPVITTKGAPWKELNTHQCGWWIDIGAKPLAAVLRQALAMSDEQRQAMGARGRQLIAQSYTWPPIAQNMRRMYQWVLGEATRPEFVL